MDSPAQQLQQFRDRIDTLDEQLARLFIERIGIIREVAVLKAAHWPMACHIRPGREGQMHRAIASRFSGTGFPPLMALALWRQLIGGSTHVESPLNIAYLTDYPEHHFLAREYFGVQIGATGAASLQEAIANLQAGGSNILVLPAPIVPPPLGGRLGGGLSETAASPIENTTSQPHSVATPLPTSPREGEEWWRDTEALRAAGLHIFAQLPVAHANLPAGCTRAVALAAITPEDSGDDLSYFVTPDGTLEVTQGFQTTREGAAFLGAHPRAIDLQQGVMHA